MSELTQEQVRELLDYEPKSGRLIWRKRAETSAGAKIFNPQFAGKEAGSIDHRIGYRRVKIFGKLYLAHRLIWLIVYGQFPEDEIDHINQRRQDNRLSNLRSVSKLENLKNQTRYKSNGSGITGVYWHSQHEKWIAAIQIGKKRFNLGLFECIEDAVIARKQAEKRLGFHRNHGSEK